MADKGLDSKFVSSGALVTSAASLMYKATAQFPAYKYAVGKTTIVTAIAVAVVSFVSQSFPVPLRALAKGEMHAQAVSAVKRADFEVSGVSCVACIRHLSRALRHTDGVLKADVSIMPPHEAIVFYDAGKTSLAKIWSQATKERLLQTVGMKNIEETPVSKLPVVVVPKR